MEILQIPNNDLSVFIPIFLLLIFFIANSFLIGVISKKFMNTVSIYSRFIIGSMFLWIVLLIFEAIAALFNLNYETIVTNTSGEESGIFSVLSVGFIFFIIIQSSLILLYLINWKSFRINFNINWAQLFSFIFILTFLLIFYYSFVLKRIDDIKIVPGSAFYQNIKMILSFSDKHFFGTHPLTDQFIIAHGVNIFLLILVASSINSLSNCALKKAYINYKKLAIALIFIALFFTLENVEDSINFLFVLPYVFALFGFYWNDHEILVNDGDKNNVLILTTMSIITFNYWFIVISILLIFIFIIFSFKIGTTIAIFQASRMIIFSFLLICLSFTNFRFPITSENSVFISKIFISAIFLVLFGVGLTAYNFIKKNHNYRNIVYKIGLKSKKNFDYVFIGLLAFEYVILFFLFFLNQTIGIFAFDPWFSNLQSFFSFFHITQENFSLFILFVTSWSILIISFIAIFIFKRKFKKQTKINYFLKKHNLIDLESNIIFVSFAAIVIIFNPLAFPVVFLVLQSNANFLSFFELSNYESKIAFLNIIWVVPLLVTLVRLNDRGIGKIKDYKYLIFSELTFLSLLLIYPIFELSRN